MRGGEAISRSAHNREVVGFNSRSAQPLLFYFISMEQLIKHYLTHHYNEPRSVRRDRLYGRRKSSTLCTKKHTLGRAGAGNINHFREGQGKRPIMNKYLVTPTQKYYALHV